MPNASTHVLQAVIRGHADISSVINTDGWRGYDGLVDIGFDKHFGVNHSNDEFVRGKNHVNGIEAFWSFAKFNGVPRHTIELHLKDCEFRFNHRHKNLYKVLLKLLKKHPL